MNCPNCGNEVRGKFCTNCGTRMEEEAAADPTATSVIRAEDLETMASEQRPDPGATATIDPSAVRSMGAEPAASPPPYEAPSEPAWQSPQPEPVTGSSWREQLGIATAPTPQAGLAGLSVPSSVQDRLAPLEGVGKQILAWAGAVLLIVGVFVSDKTYTVSASILSFSASRSLWDYGTFWAVILLLLALASAGLAFVRDYKWLLITGAAAFLICILEFLYAFSTGVDISGVSAHPSWGWILLFPGALLILAAGATRATERDAANDAGLNSVVAQLRGMVSNR